MTGLLQDRVCLIIGASGIGGATARRFAQEGARLVIVDRAAEVTHHLEHELRAHGGTVVSVIEDITTPHAEERIVAAAVAAYGQLDILVHIAGISGRRQGDGPLAECTDDGWDAVMDINVRAMMRMNRACLRSWRLAGRRGVVLNMASVLGYAFVPQQFQTVAYAAAKAAIIAMSQHAAGTYAAEGIRINVLAPGLVDTPMAARATQDPAILALMERKQPLTSAPLSAEACARAALYLCSDASAEITGVVLPVDAGWSICG